MEVTGDHSGARDERARPESDELQRLDQTSLSELAAARREAEHHAELARAAQEELQYFVYAASHDLQQPLRAIITHAQLLQRDLASSARACELISVIIDGAGQMNALVRDLLNYSRVGLDPKINEVNLSGPLQWALFNLADPVRESQAQVTIGAMPNVLADEKQFVTVFEHLLTNAIRYHGTDKPCIAVTADSDADFHTISVRDNGVGIKPEYQAKVFEPFKRLHAKQVPGSGLGLAVCHKIVRAHQGRIWVESDGEHGSTFKFALPA